MSKLLLTLLATLVPLTQESKQEEPKPSPKQETNINAPEHIKKALKFLVSQQQEDGSFPPKQAEDTYPTAVTAFSVLALLTYEGNEAAIEKGANFMMGNQDEKGYILVKKGRKSWHACVEHAYAAMTLAEIYLRYKDVTGAKFSEGFLAKVKEAAGKAVALSAEIQFKDGKWKGAWPYNIMHDEGKAFHAGECSVSIPHLEAMRSARAAGLKIDEDAWKTGLAFVRKYLKSDGRIMDHPFSGQNLPYGEVTAMAAALFYGIGETEPAEKMLSYINKTGAKKAANNVPEKEKVPVWLSGGIQLHGLLHFYIAYRRSGEVKKHEERFTAARERLISKQAEDGSWSGLYGPLWGTALSVLLIEAETNPSVHFLKEPATATPNK